MGTTFKFSRFIIYFFAGLCFFKPLIASAVPLTYQVDGLSFDLSSIGGSSSTPLTATFTTQSDSADQDPYSARGSFAPTFLSFNLGGDVLSSTNAAVVALDQTTIDQYTVTSNWGGHNASGNLLGITYARVTIYLELYDSSGTMFLNDPMTSMLSREQLRTIDSATAIIDLPSNPGFSTTGSVEVSKLPTPSTAILLIVCFPILALFRKRGEWCNRIGV